MRMTNSRSIATARRCISAQMTTIKMTPKKDLDENHIHLCHIIRAPWLSRRLAVDLGCRVRSMSRRGGRGERRRRQADVLRRFGTGQDSNDGQSPDHAWRSLDRVNAAELKPGDTVRFKCGGVWRGSLVPASGDEGAPVTYTSFGQGPKPLILGSLPRNRPEDWVKVRDNIWATLPMEYRLGEQLLDLRGSKWSRHQEAGARVELTHVEDPAGRLLHIVCTDSGSASNHVQFWGPALSVEKGDCLLLTFRARSSKPFRFPGVGILQEAPLGRGLPSRVRPTVCGRRIGTRIRWRSRSRSRRRPAGCTSAWAACCRPAPSSTSSRKACTPPRPTSPIR